MLQRILLIWVGLLLIACTSSIEETGEPGQLPVRIENPTFHVQVIPNDTTRIEARVYNSGGQELTPGSVAVQANRINNLSPIPTGSDRTIVVKAYNQNGKVIAYGEKSGVTVLGGNGTPTQTIRLSSLLLENATPTANSDSSQLKYKLDFGNQEASKRVSLKTIGDFPLPWHVLNTSDNPIWLGAENLNRGHTFNNTLKSSGNDTLKVNVSRQGLSFGEHQGQLKIVSEKTDQVLLLDVNMQVTSASNATTNQGTGRGSITGKVVANDTGNPIPGAAVTVGITEDEVIGSTTDNQGVFKLAGVPEGIRVVVISASGKSTRLEVTVVENQTKDLGSIRLQIYSGAPVPSKPVVHIYEPLQLRGNVISGKNPIITIAGTIEYIDTDPREAIISINGEQAKIGVNSDGSFSYVAILTKSGLNKIFVTAVNSRGSSRSDVVEVTYDKPQIDIHVRLNWDTNFNDIDLHVQDPQGNHTYYSDKTGIPNGELDVDDTDGYGPENFTMLHLPVNVPGRYRVGVVYFSDHGLVSPDTKCLVDIILKEGSNQEIVKRYEHILTQGEGGSIFPTTTDRTYWRVADIVVGADGSAVIEAPSN